MGKGHLEEASNVGASLDGGFVLLGCIFAGLKDVLHDILLSRRGADISTGQHQGAWA